MEFASPTEGDSLLTDIFNLAESQSRFLGMLTPEAWRDYARRGQVLAALDRTTRALLGYSAFRLPRHEVVLAHLAIDPQNRGSGTARAIVDELSRRYGNRAGIAARCRRDYPANAMWPHLGFIALGDRPGRSQAGHLLTYWWRDHGHPDLLTWQNSAPSVLPVVIDANIFVDLHGTSPGLLAPTTRLLLESVSDRIELIVTPELYNELDRVADVVERRRLKAVANTYPRIAASVGIFDTRRQSLLESMVWQPSSAQDISDLAHVAYAAAAGVPALVTRDEPALNRLAGAADTQGVRMVPPEELIALLVELEDFPAYTPAALLNTGYTTTEAGSDAGPALKGFLNNAAGEKARHFTGRLRRLAEQRPLSTRRLFSDPQGRPVALLGMSIDRSALEVSVFRQKPSPLQFSLGTQIVSQLRATAGERGLGIIRVVDPFMDPATYEALLGDGFRRTSTGAVALTLHQSIELAELPSAAEAPKALLDSEELQALGPVFELASEVSQASSPQVFASIEQQLRPLVILDAALPAWLIPIKPQFATQLFGYPRELFPRSDALGISREHVYYRGGRSGEAAPGRIFWYVSGAQHGEVIAQSELAEVDDGPPAELWRTHRRLGVYTRQQVLESAVRGQVRALRFINTELFPTPVSLGRLKRIAERNRQTLQLWSASRLNADLVTDLLKEAWRVRE